MSALKKLLNVLVFTTVVWNINQVKCDFNSTEDYTLENYLESRAVLDVLRERDNLIDPNFLVRQGLSGINFLKAFALTALLLKPYIQLPYRIYVPAQKQQELIRDIPTTTDNPTNEADSIAPSSSQPLRSKYQAKPFLDNIECMAEKVIRLPQHQTHREMFLQINIRCKPMSPKENMMASGINFNIEVPEKMFTQEQLMSMEVPPLEEFLPRTRPPLTTTTSTNKPTEITTSPTIQPTELPITSTIKLTDIPSTEDPFGKVYERPDKPFYWMNNYYPSPLLNSSKAPTTSSPDTANTEVTMETTRMPWYTMSLDKVITGKPIYWMNMFYPNGVPGLKLNTSTEGFTSGESMVETTTMRRRRRRTRSTTTTTTPLPEYEYYDVEEENTEKKSKKRRKPLISI